MLTLLYAGFAEYQVLELMRNALLFWLIMCLILIIGIVTSISTIVKGRSHHLDDAIIYGCCGLASAVMGFFFLPIILWPLCCYCGLRGGYLLKKHRNKD